MPTASVMPNSWNQQWAQQKNQYQVPTSPAKTPGILTGGMGQTNAWNGPSSWSTAQMSQPRRATSVATAQQPTTNTTEPAWMQAFRDQVAANPPTQAQTVASNTGPVNLPPSTSTPAAPVMTQEQFNQQFTPSVMEAWLNVQQLPQTAQVQHAQSVNAPAQAPTAPGNPSSPSPSSPSPSSPSPSSPSGAQAGVPGFWWGNTVAAGQQANTVVPPWVTNNIDNYETWRNPAMAAALSNYSQLLPWQQLQQNSYQYGQDFNENQRRWNEQFSWTQKGDAFNQGLATQQQTMAQQQANWAQQNWAQQNNLDTELGRAQYGNQQYANETDRLMAGYQNSYWGGQVANQAAATASQDAYWKGQVDIGQQQNVIDQMYKSGQISNQQRELALAELAQSQNYELNRWQTSTNEWKTQQEAALNQGRLGLDTELGRGQLNAANQQNVIDQMYKAGLLSNEQYANETARLKTTNESNLATRQTNIDEWRQHQDVNLAQQQIRIDDMYKSGQISNEQRQLALAELTQQQGNDLARWQTSTNEWNTQQQVALAQQQNQIDQMYKSGQLSNEQRQLALAELTQRQSNDLSRWQTSTSEWNTQQQVALAKEQNAIEQMYKSGQISNEQYANATARLQTQAQDRYWQASAGNEATQNANTLRLGEGQLRNEQFANDTQRMQAQIDQMYKSGQLTNEANRIRNELHLGQGQLQNQQFANNTQRFGEETTRMLGQRELDVQDWYNRQQAQSQAQQNQIDQMYKAGQLTNAQRELALAELTQRTDNTFRYADLTQQAQLQRESFKNQQSVAAMQAFGRFQAPNARFVRSW